MMAVHDANSRFVLPRLMSLMKARSVPDTVLTKDIPFHQASYNHADATKHSPRI